jgi:iron complex outermembrane receptor protein
MTKRLFSFIGMSMICLFAFAQDVKVSGTVSDASGNPLRGAVVIEKGTSNAVKTDGNGSYTLTIPAKRVPTSVMVRSSGAGSAEVSVDGSSSEVSFSPSLGAQKQNLNEVVVSASKKSEKVLNAPASVSVITEARIQQNTSLSIIDNLRKVAAVDIMPTGIVSNNVNVRGFNGIFSGSLMYLVDNRIASVPSLKVNAFQLVPTTNADIRSMEVVRGPASALYGPNAANGVLAIYTKSPLDMENRMEVTLGLTSGMRAGDDDNAQFNFKADNSIENLGILSPEVRIAGKISDKLGFKVSGNYLSATDFAYFDAREPNGKTVSFGNQAAGNAWASDGSAPTVFNRDFRIKKISGDARLDWRPTDNTEFVFSGGYSNNTNMELTGLGAAQARDWTSNYFQTRAKFGKLFLQYFINQTNSGNTFLIPQSETQTTFTYLKDNSSMQSMQIQHSSDFMNKKLSFTYGADAFLTRPKGNVYGIFDNGKANVNQYGLYGQGEYKINKQFTLLGALRADYQDVIDEWMFSPRGAIVYKPKENHTFRATYNRAFTSPSTLNFFLDINNGRNPLYPSQSLRGFGNSTGFNYSYNSNGLINYTNAFGQNVAVNTPYNATQVGTYGAVLNAATRGLLPSRYGSYVLNGLAGNTPAITPVDMSRFSSNYRAELAKFNTPTPTATQQSVALANAINSSKIKAATITNQEAVKSTVTQTAEIGYKGFLMDKLSVGVDLYYSRIENFVSPLTSASYAMMVDPEVLNSNTLAAYNASGAGTYTQAQLDALFGGSAQAALTGIFAAALRSPQQGYLAPTNSPYPSDILLTYLNLGTVDVAGADLTMNYQASTDLNFDFAYSHVNKDRISLLGAAEGYVALNAPKHKTALGVEYKLPVDKKGLSVRGGWRWMDAFPANSAVYTGMVNATNIVDLGLTWRPSTSPNTILSLNANNLLDHRHMFFPGTPALGRVVLFKIQHTFGVK